LELNRSLGETDAEASNHVNLGLLAEAQQQFQRAEQEYERALELDKANERSGAIAEDLLRLGRIAALRGSPDRGTGYAERAFYAYQALHDTPRAEGALQQAIDYANKAGRTEEVQRLEAQRAGRMRTGSAP
jgi:tetratricopeptide (TPR) repeat protein